MHHRFPTVSLFLLLVLFGPMAASSAQAQPVAAAEQQTYVVKQGDTLYRIAREFGLTVAELKGLNGLTSDAIAIGQRLIVRSGASVEPPVATYPPSDGIHVVREGETLYSIARQHALSVTELRALNNLSDDNVRIGQPLRLRASVPPPDLPPSETPTHLVRAGETLYSIAQRYALSVEALRALNGLGPDASVQAGMILRVGGSVGNSPSATDARTHTVASGETLYSIARRYQMTVDELVALNGLTSTNVSIGQVLKLAVGSSPVPPPPASGPREHVVQPGESLYHIAQLYGVSVEEMQRLNRLSTLDVAPGQRLQLPEASEATIPNELLEGVHVVQPGETLESVASRYGVNIQSLRDKNPSAANPLVAGEVLVLPKSEALTSYQVREGDTLDAIARRFQVSVSDLRTANSLSDNRITVGQVLRIPGRGNLPDVLGHPDATGLAVIYPDSFSGRLTASGERYDPQKHTASHPTLPLGTTVLLRNPATGQRVHVRINDRRPFGESYLMEISAAAARDLGLTNTEGQTVEVRVSN